MRSWQTDRGLSCLESDSIVNAMLIDSHIGFLVPILRLVSQLFSLVREKRGHPRSYVGSNWPYPYFDRRKSDAGSSRLSDADRKLGADEGGW